MTKTTMKKLKGFSLVELLVAMLIGLIIISGAFSLHSTTRVTQRVNEAQMDMVADARFAIELISYDLRHAGMWGRLNTDDLVDCSADGPNCVPNNGDTVPSSVTISGDCGSSGSTVWAYDLTEAVFAYDDSTGNLYSGSCIPSSEGYVNGTDILVVKYADSNSQNDILRTDQFYVRSNFLDGRIFYGNTPPLLRTSENSSTTGNFLLKAHAYYISDYTDEIGDGIPSLRRAALVSGPEVENQLVISGVVDMQVQFGRDLNANGGINGNATINAYLDANQIDKDAGEWADVYSVKIWLLLRGDKIQDIDGIEKTYSLPGKPSVTYGGDGFRYFMVTSVVSLQNLNQ